MCLFSAHIQFYGQLNYSYFANWALGFTKFCLSFKLASSGFKRLPRSIRMYNKIPHPFYHPKLLVSYDQPRTTPPFLDSPLTIRILINTQRDIESLCPIFKTSSPLGTDRTAKKLLTAVSCPTIASGQTKGNPIRTWLSELS